MATKMVTHRIEGDLLSTFDAMIKINRPGITRSHAIREAMELWIDVHQTADAEHVADRLRADESR